MRFEDCKKAVKAMVDVKKSVDEETFNKMFKIFNDKYPEFEIKKIIGDIYYHNYELTDTSLKYYLCGMYNNYRPRKSQKVYKLFISQLINFVFNLYMLNPNYYIFRHWKNHVVCDEEFQLPKRRKIFNKDNIDNTFNFIISLYCTCACASTTKIISEAQN